MDNLSKLNEIIKKYQEGGEITEVIELPENTNDKKFVYGKNKFKQFKKLELTK